MAENTEKSDLIARAQRFATKAHERIDHRRKYSEEPYDVHLADVARIVASVTEDEEMIAAAWLHDVVEDTQATLEDLEGEFGEGVAALVENLTDVSRPGDGNRAVRKAIDRRHSAAASPRAKTIKLADLIDNCQDITGNDPGFARVFLAEMATLLEVLEQGDHQLYRRACKTHAKCCERLGLAGLVLADRPDVTTELEHSEQHVARLFVEAFTAGDIAAPLRSFDAVREAAEIASIMDEERLDVVGVRKAGAVAGYLRREDLGAGPTSEARADAVAVPAGADVVGACGDHARVFSAGQIVSGPASLSDVILVLTRHDHCFVSLLGETTGVLVRDDINNPVVRMWLFGIITIVEMALGRQIRAIYGENGWLERLPETRIAKARELLAERSRRDRGGALLDCLQLPDKARILIDDGTLLDWLGTGSRNAARNAVKDIVSLRDHLAHAQDIVSHDWTQIARIAYRVEEICGLHTRAANGAASRGVR
ncbi:MAG: HD domain-containing protein [Candidatus Binatia bacterium]